MYAENLIEGICLHAFEHKQPFSAHNLKRIRMLKAVYQLDLTAAGSHHLVEKQSRP